MNKKLQTAKPDDFSLTTNLNQASEAGSHDTILTSPSNASRLRQNESVC